MSANFFVRSALYCVLVLAVNLPAQTVRGVVSGTIGNSTAPVVLATTSLRPAYSGASYSQTLSSSGGSGGYAYTVASGSFPTGISMSSGGVLSGSSTVVGYYPLSITVTDAALNTMTRSYFMNLWPVLDIYGGINSIDVSGCTPGYFQILQDGTHWIWATPLCKAFVERSVYDVAQYIDAAAYNTKFSGNYVTW